MKKAVIIFTRIPIPGQTKTRLMPYFSPKECARLHECCLKDIYTSVSKAEADVFVAYEGVGDEGWISDLFGRELTCFSQKGEGLGERMLCALSRVLELGYEKAVLVGSDIPELTTEHLQEAFHVLSSKDLVLGPTFDGGYYLIGMKEPVREAFEGQTYSHENVYKETRSRLIDAGYTVGSVGKLHDLDERKDLAVFRNRARESKDLAASCTGRFLAWHVRISVIVPIYNEESTIEAIQAQLRPYQKKCEIIFVDGGSTDRTLELIDPSFKVLHSQKGRAKQMNLGAEKSSGDILFFLHSDSELPQDFLKEIRLVMRNHRVGCFGIAFHSANFFMWTNRIISNHRAVGRGVAFGDQGIFLDRDLFFEVGKYPELPIMEDYQFSLNLQEVNRKPGITMHRIYTSDRRYPQGTVRKLEIMWKMYDLRRQYRGGVAIEEISRQYRDIR